LIEIFTNDFYKGRAMRRKDWIKIILLLFVILVLFCLYKELYRDQPIPKAVTTKDLPVVEANTTVMPKKEENITVAPKKEGNTTAIPKNEKNITNDPIPVPAAPVEPAKLNNLISLTDDLNITGPLVRREPSFTAIKEHDQIILKGELSTKAEKYDTENQFQHFSTDIDSSELTVDPGVTEAKWLSLVHNIAHSFSILFEKGSIDYKEHRLSLQGEMISEKMQEKLDEILSAHPLEDVVIENNTTVIEPSTARQKLKKQLFELLYEEDIQFEVNKDILTPDALPLLDNIASALKEFNKQSIIIEGHTDSDGVDLYNLQLSQKRAQAVKEYLIKHGIKENRIKAVGYGQTKPIVPNTTQENKRINRRVELKIRGE
jgi:outer membrane protein OmpA-like peptidoglycan-associated protein